MSLFRKKPADVGADDGEIGTAIGRALDRVDEQSAGSAPPLTDDVAPVGTAERHADTGATTGPFDVADADDDRPRIDLGSVRVPAVDGMEVRVETAEDGQIVSVGLVVEGTVLQVQAFAAPRSEGIWDEVREELARGLRSQGGKVEESTGPFGPELRARLRVQRPDGTSGDETARFVGADGPRWFLRGVISGAGAVDPARASVVEDMFRGTVVVRGQGAAPPREPLPITLPGPVGPDAADPDAAGPDAPASS